MSEESKENPRDAAKHAAPPARVKKVKTEATADDDDAPSASPLKQKVLATALSRAIVIATLIGTAGYLVTEVLTARFVLVSSPSASSSFAYRLDRLTGGVEFCGQQQCTPVAQATK